MFIRPWILRPNDRQMCDVARPLCALVCFVLYVAAPAHAQQALVSSSPETSGLFGTSVSGVPDVNGDGVGDLAVGAPQEDPGASPTDAGRVHVYSGATGAFLRVLASPVQQASGFFGQSVAGIPDLDGDDRGDIVVGSREGSSPLNAGQVHIFSGSTGVLIRTLVSPNAEASGYFGQSVAGVPDVDGDGMTDIAVGAPNENPGGSPDGAGRAYLFSGATGALLQTFVSANEEVGGGFGTAVAGVPSVDAGAGGDIIVGAPNEDPGVSPLDSGRVYMFSGGSGTLIYTLASSAPTPFGRFGSSVAGLINADGDSTERGDILVGAALEDLPGNTDGGRAYIFSGDTGLPWRTLTAASSNGTGGRFGTSVSGVADVDGDGRTDVIVGAPGLTYAALAGSGAAFVCSGSTGAILYGVSSITPEATGNFGIAVSTFPTPPGIAPGILVGANQENGSFTDSGRAYFFVSLDCNGNGIRDDIEIAQGSATDCNGNLRPDVCDNNGYFADCNGNQVQDACDIAAGTSMDVDSDGVPDECFNDCVVSLDCNNNMIPDANELTGNDCNGDLVPDTCQTQLPFMVRVSENAAGDPASVAGNAVAAFDSVMSSDRHLIAFYANATNLVPGDANGLTDVFVKNMLTGAVENVHVTSGGAQANGAAFATIDMTPDGRFVAFMSQATNLVAGAVGYQIYLYDRVVHTIELVSKSAASMPGNGTSTAPALSADGRYIAFYSSSSNLVANDTNGRYDVFRRDRMTNAVIRVSIGAGGQQANGNSGVNIFNNQPYISSGQVAISANGRYVAYASDASNLVPFDGNGRRDVFVRDCELGLTTRVSVSSSGVEGNRGSGGESTAGWQYGGGADLSADGRYVVFESAASNLVTTDINNRNDVFVHDRATGITTKLTIGGTGSSPLILSPSISDDGCFVTFVSNIHGLVPGQMNGDITFDNVFRYDRSADAIQLVVANQLGSGGNGNSQLIGLPRISSDGQWVTFTTVSNNLTLEPANGQSQVYLRWMAWEADCDGNGVPHDCEPLGIDCNANGISDSCECGCPGDTNGDLRIDGRDVKTFITCFLTGCSPVGCYCADVSGDQIVDLADVALFADRLISSVSGVCP